MDLLRASSNFLNIHGAWVLGGLIAAGLIKTKSNQKKQRAESDNTTPTPKNPCPRCEGSAGFPKEFYFHPKRLDFIPCRNCIEMGGNCPGCMEVLPGLTRDRDPWEAFDEGCGKCGWSWADATAIRSTTTPWNVHLDHPGAQRWFASEDDAYAYAYTEGHRDSRIGSPYKPLLKKVNRDSFRNVVRQKAEGVDPSLPDHGQDWDKTRANAYRDRVFFCLYCGHRSPRGHGSGNGEGGKCGKNGEECIYHKDWRAESFGAEKIGSRLKRKQYLTVADLKKALKNAKDTDRIAAGDLHDEDRIYTPMKRIYRDRIENNDYLIIVSDDGAGGLYWDKDTEDLWNAEDDECSVCDGLGWRYVEDDDGDSVRAPCHECGGGSSTGSPTGVVAYDADNYDRATHGPYLPVGAVKRFLNRMPPREEFYVSFVKANNTVRDMECILTKPYDPDNDVAGVMELG